jgi:hypothetical protein
VCGKQAVDAGRMLERFVYSESGGAMPSGMLRLRRGARTTDEPPEALLVADEAGVRDLGGAATGDPRGWGVLLDRTGSRALFGPPYLVRSVLTRLVWLDRQALRGRKVGDLHAAGGVITWRIVWPPSP